MGIQIVLAWSEDCEKELIQMGFEKQEVYTKTPPFAGNSDEEKKVGDAEIFGMKHLPYQFVTTSWWGAMNPD